MRQKFKVGDLVRLTVDQYPESDLHMGGVYPVCRADRDGDLYVESLTGFKGYFFQSEVEAAEDVKVSDQTASKLPRLEIQAAPQGGFLVIAPSASMGTVNETLSAHSKLDDALDFVRRAMA